MFMFLGLFHPKPKFKIGQLVRTGDHLVYRQYRYLLIDERRWLKREWVYNGIVYQVEDNQIVIATYSSCVGEVSLSPVIRLNSACEVLEEGD